MLMVAKRQMGHEACNYRSGHISDYDTPPSTCQPTHEAEKHILNSIATIAK
jgi:hypothetical protein